MSTDLPSQGPPSGRGAPPRAAAQPPRSGASAVAIVVALVAALLGFFILKKIDTNSTNIATAGGTPATNPIAAGASTSAPPGSTATTPAPTAAAAPTIARGPIVVVVANSSGVKGAAASITTALKTLGYKTLTATNSTNKKAITTTAVFFATGNDAAAAQVISDLKLPNTIVALPIPADNTQIPVLAGSRAGAAVVVILGTDLANTAGAATPTAPNTVTKQATINSTAASKVTTTTG